MEKAKCFIEMLQSIGSTLNYHIEDMLDMVIQLSGISGRFATMFM